MYNLLSPDVFFQAQNVAKTRFWPLGVLTTLPKPLVGWGEGNPLPILLDPRRFRRFDLGADGARLALDACGVSALRPPLKNPGYAYVTDLF